MDVGALTKITAETAQEICRVYPLTETAEDALVEGATPATFLQALTEKDLFLDAASFLAHALPKREATWWACLCARDDLPADAKPKIVAALEAAEAWVFKPNDERRRDALAKAEAADLTGTPSALAAAAAGWSGGSLAALGEPDMPPGDTLTPTAVFSAVTLVALKGDQEEQASRFRQALAWGIDIANGGTGRPKA